MYTIIYTADSKQILLNFFILLYVVISSNYCYIIKFRPFRYQVPNLPRYYNIMSNILNRRFLKQTEIL